MTLRDSSTARNVRQGEGDASDERSEAAFGLTMQATSVFRVDSVIRRQRAKAINNWSKAKDIEG